MGLRRVCSMTRTDRLAHQSALYSLLLHPMFIFRFLSHQAATLYMLNNMLAWKTSHPSTVILLKCLQLNMHLQRQPLWLVTQRINISAFQTTSLISLCIARAKWELIKIKAFQTTSLISSCTARAKWGTCLQLSWKTWRSITGMLGLHLRKRVGGGTK